MERLLFAGDYPDPSIIRVNGTYYITHSSFLYHPGLLIWRSDDLQTWKPVGFAVDQPGWDIWAPELVHHKGRFFVYYFARSTAGERRGTNWVVHAPSIDGPWSAPIEIDCRRIDPGHAMGPDGERYLHFSSGTAALLSDDGLRLTGELTTVYDGWRYPDEWRVEGFHVEGPKIVCRGDWYYLTSAQGGTAGPATSHMAVVARSKTPTGPWENSPHNPLVHTYSREEPWWSTGHATLVDTPDGEWIAVYHGYRAGYHTLGRQSLIAPVRWEDEWPVADRDRRDHSSGGQSLAPLSLSDDFAGQTLGPQWRRFDRLPAAHVHVEGEALQLTCAGSASDPPHPLVCIPADPSYRAEVTIDRSRLGEDDCAGLLLYYDERCFAGILLDGRGRLLLSREGSITGRVLAQVPESRCRVMLLNDRNELEFHLREGSDWKRLDAALEVSGYNHNVFGRFLSLRIGLIAVGAGTASFERFTYSAC